MNCPNCRKDKISKSGFVETSNKQRYQCKTCKKIFVENPEHRKIPQEKVDLICRMLLERNSLSWIARSAKVLKRWLQYYINKKFRESLKRPIVSSETVCRKNNRQLNAMKFGLLQKRNQTENGFG